MRWFLFALTGIFLANAAPAHEVRPAIGDLTIDGEALRLELRLNAEAILAGVDLEGVVDTDATGRSEAVDALRALPAEEIEARLARRAGEIAEGLDLRADGRPVALTITAIETEPVGNPALPRETTLALAGTLPRDAGSIALGWPARYGTLILRQQGVEGGYTGYLAGARSGPIPVPDTALRGWAQSVARSAGTGFSHVIPGGLDHLLLVLALLMGSKQVGHLAWSLPALALGHAAACLLAALGLAALPRSLVEPALAALILVVAVQNLRADRPPRWRAILPFAFALLHGLGFASVLQALGLAPGPYIGTVLGFALGVWIGEILLCLAAFLLVWQAMRVDDLLGRVAPARAGYGVVAVLSLVAALVLLWPEPGSAATWRSAAFLVAAGVIAGLCALSVHRLDMLDAYRRLVAVPVSALIAASAAMLFVARVFL